MIAAETMTGIDHKVMALPHDELRAVRKKYNRLTDQLRHKSFQRRLTVASPRFRRAESRRTWRDRCSCGP
jgi:hypothetical protein